MFLYLLVMLSFNNFLHFVGESSYMFFVLFAGINKLREDFTGYNLVRSTKNKLQCAFIQLDIMEFYPSIMETILGDALSFAKQHVKFRIKTYE